MHPAKSVGALVAAIIATGLGLTAPAGAAAVEVKAFQATAAAGQIRYELVVCAPVGTPLTFRTELSAKRGTTYVLPVLRGRQQSACPTWTFEQDAAVPPGRYRTRVVIESRRSRPAHTRRVPVHLRRPAAARANRPPVG